MGALGGRAAEDVVLEEVRLRQEPEVISSKLLQWLAKWLLDLDEY